MSLETHPVGILGTGAYLPERVLTNEELSRMVDTTDEWIVSHTGIRERRIKADDETNASMSARAAQAALDDAGVSAEDLDMIIVGTNSPDRVFPGVGPTVQGILGASRAGGMDVQAGCPGSLYALAAGAAGVSSGIWRCAAVIGGEAMSPFIDWTDRSTCALFGDGAGACVIGPWRPGAPRIVKVSLRADGTLADLIDLPAGMSAEPATEETVAERRHYLKMRGQDVYKFVNREIPKFLEGFCEECGTAPSDVSTWIFHQANIRILDGVMDRLGVPTERVPVNLDRYGNTSAASIMICLHEAMKSGADMSRAVMVSFGAGMTYGAAMIETQRDQTAKN